MSDDGQASRSGQFFRLDLAPNDCPTTPRLSLTTLQTGSPVRSHSGILNLSRFLTLRVPNLTYAMGTSPKSSQNSSDGGFVSGLHGCPRFRASSGGRKAAYDSCPCRSGEWIRVRMTICIGGNGQKHVRSIETTTWDNRPSPSDISGTFSSFC